MRLYSDAELAQILDKDIFRKISDAADSLGVECYVVGGFVRDIFLGRPSNDIDVVVVGSGIAVATELKKRLGRRAHLSVFRNFGTAQVKFFLLNDESVTLSDERVALSVERVALSDEGVAMSEKQEKTSSLNAQRSARLQQETLSKRSGERTLNATRSSLRSAPTGDSFEAKRRKNTHRSTLNPHRPSFSSSPHQSAGSLSVAAQIRYRDISHALCCSRRVVPECLEIVFGLRTAGKRGR